MNPAALDLGMTEQGKALEYRRMNSAALGAADPGSREPCFLVEERVGDGEGAVGVDKGLIDE
jgi:hypothetical protein